MTTTDSSQPLRIVFCFPYRGVGGVPVVFTRLALLLCQDPRYEISFVDYADGCMSRLCRDPKIKRFIYDDGKPCEIPSGALVVFQAMTPWSIFPQLHIPQDARIFFWHHHPYNLIPMLPGFRETMMRQPGWVIKILLFTLLLPFTLKLRRFAKFLLKKDALVFMDRPNLVTCSGFLHLKVKNPELLPIPVEGPFDLSKKEAERPLTLSWIGRVVDFKFHILSRVLKDLSEVAQKGREITFDIVGDGEKISDLKEVVRTLSPHLKTRFLGNFSPEEVKDYLAEKTDAVFAMGNCTLEAGRQGLPTILLDVAYGYVPETYRYRFLYETTGYSIGDIIGQTRSGREGKTMSEVFDLIVRDQKSIGEACRDYVKRSHNLGPIAHSFIEYSTRTRLTWGDLEKSGFLRRSLPYRLLVSARRFNFPQWRASRTISN